MTETSSDADLRTLLRLCYQTDPELYARHELQVEWWSKQREIARALVEHGRVFVKAGNGPGKTWLAAGLVNWFYDCFRPGICLTTAPTGQQVKDVLWKDVRVQRRGRAGAQPKAPRMEDAPDHYAVGYTAETDEAFQGRHDENLFIIFDEATAITSGFWDAANGMQPKFWLVLLNPTDTASRAYEESLKPEWRVITLNSLEHPNVLAGQRNEALPYPRSRLTWQWVLERAAEWCTPVPASERRPSDLELGGQLWRPGPLFQARVLGQWPDTSGTSVWSEQLWEEASRAGRGLPEAGRPVLGCDVARFGDDFTTIIGGVESVATEYETHNGWDLVRTTDRLIELCHLLGERWNTPPREVQVNVDDDGLGGGCTDLGKSRGYRFTPCSGASRANRPEDYPNRRSESWFAGAQVAREGRLDVSRLPVEARANLRRQVMAPKWRLDSQGRRVVEPKEETKKRVGRSPDDADALNLFLSRGGSWTTDPMFWGWLARNGEQA